MKEREMKKKKEELRERSWFELNRMILVNILGKLKGKILDKLTLGAFSVPVPMSDMRKLEECCLATTELTILLRKDYTQGIKLNIGKYQSRKRSR